MNSLTRIGPTFALLACVALSQGALAQSGDFDTELHAIQQQWAEANYASASDKAREQSLQSLAERADAFAQHFPGRAEALVWQGIVLSTYAGAKGGLGALGLARDARDKLQAALKLDPEVLDGSAYTSLGTLYYKVPGFPLGFGNDAQAGDYLRKALSVNPDGIDQNYFYGEYLYELGDYVKAERYLQKALAAPPRPDRQLADEGRRREINALMERVHRKMG